MQAYNDNKTTQGWANFTAVLFGALSRSARLVGIQAVLSYLWQNKLKLAPYALTCTHSTYTRIEASSAVYSEFALWQAFSLLNATKEYPKSTTDQHYEKQGSYHAPSIIPAITVSRFSGL